MGQKLYQGEAATADVEKIYKECGVVLKFKGKFPTGNGLFNDISIAYSQAVGKWYTAKHEAIQRLGNGRQLGELDKKLQRFAIPLNVKMTPYTSNGFNNTKFSMVYNTNQKAKFENARFIEITLPHTVYARNDKGIEAIIKAVQQHKI